jgi:diguanylate cyclase (GGDEF)-like protein
VIDFMSLGDKVDAGDTERLLAAGSPLALTVPHMSDIAKALQMLAAAVADHITDGGTVAVELLRRLTLAVLKVSGVASQRFLDEVENQIGTCPVTGLGLRARSELELQQRIGMAQQSGGKLTIAFIDLDDLKVYNDTEGYEAGDTALRAIADALRDPTMSDASAFRWGGDEFLTIHQDVDGSTVATILSAFEPPAVPKFSFGVATYPDEASDLTELAYAAQNRMKEQKRRHKAGRGA